MPQEETDAAPAAPAAPMMTLDEMQSIYLADDLDIDRLMDVSALVRHSSRARNQLAKLVENLRGEKPADGPDAVRLGAGLWLQGAYREAFDVLQNQRSHIAGAFFLGLTQLSLGRPGDAVEVLEKTVNRKPNSVALKQTHVEACIDAGQADGARAALEELESMTGQSALILTLKGRILDLEGAHDDARDSYKKALEIEPDNSDAMFRLAYSMDLYGDDDEAIVLYRRCAQLPHPNVNALINLGVLYEDRNEYDNAIECYETVLKTYPNHRRASMFYKDSLSSMEELVDEERERLEDRRMQTLKIPITDFELSVRSRNCLNKMKIRTLGDLVQKSEAELLSYKNFGETSLAEIKAILDSKNLRLGMSLDDLEKRDRRRRFESLFQQGADTEEIAGKPLGDLGLSIRSRRCMETLGLATVGELMSKSERELLLCKNFGQTSLIEVKRKLAEQGVGLRGPTAEELAAEEAEKEAMEGGSGDDDDEEEEEK